MSGVLIPVLQSGGSVAAVLTVFGTVSHRYLKRFIKDEASALVGTALEVAVNDLKSQMNDRFDQSDKHKQEIAAKQDEMSLSLATQFGGNGNGLRQAVNDLTASVARLEGRFDQHTLEGSHA